MTQKFSLMYQHNENESWVEIHKTLFELMEYGEPKGMDDYTLVNTRQRTGLSDKNGKEIYVGDVVKDTSIYKEGDNVEIGDMQDGIYCEFYDYDMFQDPKIYMEIIGNSYENETLLSSNK